jgi:hypothetical protein
MISSAWVALVFAVVLLVIGVWGRRNADNLVLRTLSPSAQRAKQRSIRRGAVASMVGGGVFLVLAIAEVVIWVTHR